MTRLLYRWFNAFWVDRLMTQHRFESIASSREGLRMARAYRRWKGTRRPVGGKPASLADVDKTQ